MKSSSSKDIMSKLDYEGLSRAFMVANTPLFLYKRLRENESVRLISASYDTKTLINIFNKIVASSNLSKLENIILVYAVLSALSYKTIKEVGVFFKSLPKYRLKWFAEFSDIYIGTTRITDLHTIDNNFKIMGATSVHSGSSSQKTRMTVVSPKVTVRKNLAKRGNRINFNVDNKTNDLIKFYANNSQVSSVQIQKKIKR